MNERDWRQLEARLIDAHREADPPVSPEVWRGIDARIATGRPRRWLWLAMGATVLAAAVAVALWWLPASAPPTVSVVPWLPPLPVSRPAVPVTPPPVPSPVTVPPPVTVPQLQIALQTQGAVTFAISVDAGRIELEPCRGRFVNVTLLDGPHHRITLDQSSGRVEVGLDGGKVMRGGVAHILVPADTHLVLSTRRGDVVVRGLGGPMEIDSESGAVRIDTSSRIDPVVRVTTDSGAITWSGRCGGGCRIEARSRTGDITLRAPDRAAFTRGAARGESQAGLVHLEELSCTDPRCASLPLPWRQHAAGGHE